MGFGSDVGLIGSKLGLKREGVLTLSLKALSCGKISLSS